MIGDDEEDVVDVGEDMNAAQDALVEADKEASGSSNGSFASHVRDALQTIGRSARSKDVTQVLERQGIESTSKFPLKSVVTSELIRMSKRGNSGIQRVRKGLYRCKPPENESGQD